MAGAEGIQKATEGYDFSPIDEAISGYRTPYTFNFAQLPEEYANTAYAQGAKGIQRQAAGDLEKLSERVGTRRPGVLAKLGETSQRNTQEQLAGLNAQTQLEKMRQNVELGKEQQEKQADYNLRRYSGLADLATGKIGTQAGILGQERAYADQPIQYLQNLYGSAANATNQGAQAANQKRSGTLGFLGNVAKMFI